MEKKQKGMNWVQLLYLATMMVPAYIVASLFNRGELPMPVMASGETQYIIGVALLLAVFLVALNLRQVIWLAGEVLGGRLAGCRPVYIWAGRKAWVFEKGGMRKGDLGPFYTGLGSLSEPSGDSWENARFGSVLLGGALADLAAGCLFGGLYWLWPRVPLLSAALLSLALASLCFGLFHIVPMKRGSAANGSMMALQQRRHPAARRSLWMLMKVNAQSVAGVRLRDMPEEWFDVPADEDMAAFPVCAQAGAVAVKRVVEKRDYDGARSLFARLAKPGVALSPLNRYDVVNDQMIAELLTENRAGVVDSLLSDGQKDYLFHYGENLSVMCMNYMLALLHEKDAGKAEEIKARFDRVSPKAVYRSNVSRAKEMMELARRKAEGESRAGATSP